MTKCVYCEEEAGEGFDVCLNCRNKKAEVTLTNKKPIGVYLKKILELGMEHNKITIKAMYHTANYFNFCIKPIFEYWGLEETGRKWVVEKDVKTGKELKSLHIYLEMIPSLRGIKTDKRK